VTFKVTSKIWNISKQCSKFEWRFSGGGAVGWHGESLQPIWGPGCSPQQGLGAHPGQGDRGKAPPPRSWKLFNSAECQKKVANMTLSFDFANSVNDGYLWFVSLKLTTSSSSFRWQWQTDNLTIRPRTQKQGNRPKAGRHGSFHLWMHVWVAGKAVWSLVIPR